MKKRIILRFKKNTIDKPIVYKLGFQYPEGEYFAESRINDGHGD